MNPGEAERKLAKAEELLERQDKELDAYKEFFEASLQMNIAAAGLPAAARVQRALRELEVIRIRKGVKQEDGEALSALKNISFDK